MATMGKDEKGLEKGEDKIPALKDTQVEHKNDRKSSEIQVILIASPETLQPLNEGKLLPQRSRSSKRLLPGKQPPKSAKEKRVPLDAISCISDYSVLSSIDFQPRNTPSGKQSHQGGTSLLTSKSLKDFTNSPEGKMEMSSPSIKSLNVSFHVCPAQRVYAKLPTMILRHKFHDESTNLVSLWLSFLVNSLKR